MVKLLQNISLEKALQPPFLVTAVLQKHNLVVWSLLCNATHSTSHTTCYDNVRHLGNRVIISNGFFLVLAAV
jgi:hypothetical protein